MKEQFDVFLAHNSEDKSQVRIISQKLKQRSLSIWLDEEQIPPGRSFQDEIQKAIPQIRSAAIIIGLKDLGNWQAIELQTFTKQFVERGSSVVIPVLLPGVDRIPEKLPFLQNFSWVKFNNIEDEIAFGYLEWGITGIRPPCLSSYSNHNPISNSVNVDPDSLSLPTYEFDVVRVNAKGEEIERKRGKAEYISEDLGNDVKLDMVFVPAGDFTMGSSDGDSYKNSYRDEYPQRTVKVSTFFMSKYPITQAQWGKVAMMPKIDYDLNLNPSRFKGKARPVEQVTWKESVEFCARLSKHANHKYRLPSEAEWEYACRAGTETPFHFGETITPELANYNGEEPFRETTDVDTFPPNAFGLYDMHGNVYEWCEDDWFPNYEGAPPDSTPRKNNKNQSSLKVLRAGSWYLDTKNCRSSYRIHNGARFKHCHFGFRVVCTLS